MMPRSSRSHSTLVPADEHDRLEAPRELAVPAPRDDREGARPGPARSNAGRSVAEARSSMPPVPNVILARPGRTQPWPMQRRLLVADDAGDRRRARQRRRLADDAGRVDDGREHGSAGCAAARARRSSQPRAVCADEAGDAGVRRVGHVGGAVRRGSRRSRCRRCRSTGRGSLVRSGSARSSRNASLVADWLGASRRPSAWSIEAHAAVRRSCQPTPGPTGSPVRAVPHDRRRPLVGDADRVDRPAGRERGRAPPRARRSAIATGSNSTKPGAGEVGSTSRWWTWSTVASSRTIAARSPLVPTSTTRRLTSPGDRAASPSSWRASRRADPSPRPGRR